MLTEFVTRILTLDSSNEQVIFCPKICVISPFSEFALEPFFELVNLHRLESFFGRVNLHQKESSFVFIVSGI
jgi:hypothetical protein